MIKVNFPHWSVTASCCSSRSGLVSLMEYDCVKLVMYDSQTKGGNFPNDMLKLLFERWNTQLGHRQ